jgi:hypothetical protein
LPHLNLDRRASAPVHLDGVRRGSNRGCCEKHTADSKRGHPHQHRVRVSHTARPTDSTLNVLTNTVQGTVIAPDVAHSAAVDLTATDWIVVRSSWDPVRLWELVAAHPDVGRSELSDSLGRLVTAELIQCHPPNEDGPVFTIDEALRYIGDDGQWLDLSENPWPARGPIYDFSLTESGRELLRQN